MLLVARSDTYPNVCEQDMFAFCLEHKIISNCRYHPFTRADFTRIYETTNIEWVPDELNANPDDLLNRSEFLEILMRIAHAKYATKRVVNTFDPTHEETEDEEEHHLTVAEGLEKILERAIIPTSEKEDISGFREFRCHQDAYVCQTIMNNHNHLRKLYANFIQPRYGSASEFTLQSATSMLRIAAFSSNTISDADIRKCYSLSKMTVIDELADGENYLRMLFVEFQELLCRISHHVYKDKLSGNSDLTSPRPASLQDP